MLASIKEDNQSVATNGTQKTNASDGNSTVITIHGLLQRAKLSPDDAAWLHSKIDQVTNNHHEASLSYIGNVAALHQPEIASLQHKGAPTAGLSQSVLQHLDFDDSATEHSYRSQRTSTPLRHNRTMIPSASMPHSRYKPRPGSYHMPSASTNGHRNRRKGAMSLTNGTPQKGRRRKRRHNDVFGEDEDPAWTDQARANKRIKLHRSASSRRSELRGNYLRPLHSYRPMSKQRSAGSQTEGTSTPRSQRSQRSAQSRSVSQERNAKPSVSRSQTVQLPVNGEATSVAAQINAAAAVQIDGSGFCFVKNDSDSASNVTEAVCTDTKASASTAKPQTDAWSFGGSALSAGGAGVFDSNVSKPKDTHSKTRGSTTISPISSALSRKRKSAESSPTEESSENVENKPLQRKQKASRSPLKDKKNGLHKEDATPKDAKGSKLADSDDDDDLKALKEKIDKETAPTTDTEMRPQTPQMPVTEALSRANTMIIDEAKDKDKKSVAKDAEASEEKDTKETPKVVKPKPKRQLSYLQQVMLERRDKYQEAYRTRLTRLVQQFNPKATDKVDGFIRKYGDEADKMHGFYVKVCAKYKVTPCHLFDGQTEYEPNEKESAVVEESEADKAATSGFSFNMGKSASPAAAEKVTAFGVSTSDSKKEEETAPKANGFSVGFQFGGASTASDDKEKKTDANPFSFTVAANPSGASMFSSSTADKDKDTANDKMTAVEAKTDKKDAPAVPAAAASNPWSFNSKPAAPAETKKPATEPISFGGAANPFSTPVKDTAAKTKTETKSSGWTFGGAATSSFTTKKPEDKKPESAEKKVDSWGAAAPATSAFQFNIPSAVSFTSGDDVNKDKNKDKPMTNGNGNASSMFSMPSSKPTDASSAFGASSNKVSSSFGNTNSGFSFGAGNGSSANSTAASTAKPKAADSGGWSFGGSAGGSSVFDSKPKETNTVNTLGGGSSGFAWNAKPTLENQDTAASSSTNNGSFSWGGSSDNVKKNESSGSGFSWNAPSTSGNAGSNSSAFGVSGNQSAFGADNNKSAFGANNQSAFASSNNNQPQSAFGAPSGSNNSFSGPGPFGGGGSGNSFSGSGPFGGNASNSAAAPNNSNGSFSFGGGNGGGGFTAPAAAGSVDSNSFFGGNKPKGRRKVVRGKRRRGK